jgi:hypothetical protein
LIRLYELYSYGRAAYRGEDVDVALNVHAAQGKAFSAKPVDFTRYSYGSHGGAGNPEVSGSEGDAKARVAGDWTGDADRGCGTALQKVDHNPFAARHRALLQHRIVQPPYADGPSRRPRHGGAEVHDKALEGAG